MIMNQRLRAACELLLTLLVFVAVLTGYVTSRNITSFDSVWSMHTSMSLLREGNPDLDEYRDLIERLSIRHATETIDGHLYNVYPIGSSVVAAPLVALFDFAAQRAWGSSLNRYFQLMVPEPFEMLIASIIMALAVVVMYRIARLFLSPLSSLALTFIFAFCTSAWSVASRALWQHGPTMLMLSAALYLLLLARRRPWLVQFASLPLELAYVIRPTNSISVAILTLYVLIAYRRYFLRYLFWALWVAVPFGLLNLAVYHSPLPTYYSWFKEFSTSTLLEALAGNLISPSRGLLIYSPVLLFSIAGIALKLKRHVWEKLDTALLGIIGLHWFAISIWPIWWAGWSFGPRIFSDMLPYLMYFMIPVFEALPHLTRRARVLTVSSLALTIAVSFFIHYRGANALEVLRWNTQPLDVDQFPGRVWDWQDVQFLRGLKWGAPVEVSVSGIPIEQLARSTYATMGSNNLHVREFDAATSLIAPPQPAWQIIRHDRPVGQELAHIFGDITPPGIAETVVDRQAYDLYHFDLGSRLLAEAQQAQHTAAWSTATVPDRNAVQQTDLPVRFGTTLDFIGFRVITTTASNDLTILTYWKIQEPADRPLQMFIHLLGPDGQIAAQQDGFGVQPTTWQPGDIVAQVTQLDLPHRSERTWLEIGWYDQASLQRLPLNVADQRVGDRLLLPQ
jgi:hypothetical protein